MRSFHCLCWGVLVSFDCAHCTPLHPACLAQPRVLLHDSWDKHVGDNGCMLHMGMACSPVLLPMCLSFFIAISRIDHTDLTFFCLRFFQVTLGQSLLLPPFFSGYPGAKPGPQRWAGPGNEPSLAGGASAGEAGGLCFHPTDNELPRVTKALRSNPHWQGKGL